MYILALADDWAFNSDRGSDIATRHAKIPTETDVLLVHGPPIGYVGEGLYKNF